MFIKRRQLRFKLENIIPEITELYYRPGMIGWYKAFKSSGLKM